MGCAGVVSSADQTQFGGKYSLQASNSIASMGPNQAVFSDVSSILAFERETDSGASVGTWSFLSTKRQRRRNVTGGSSFFRLGPPKWWVFLFETTKQG